jgi:hypothetical protein
MTHTRRAFALSLPGAVLCGVAGFELRAQDQLGWENTFCSALNQLLSPTPAPSKMSPAEAIAWQTPALKMTAAAFDSGTSVPAIFELWLREEMDFVQLQWWKKDERVARALVVSLFLCAGEQRMAWQPDFGRQVQRFADKERRERSDEMNFVVRYNSAIARILAAAFMNNGKRDSLLYRNYMVAAEQGGAELPCLPRDRKRP